MTDQAPIARLLQAARTMQQARDAATQAAQATAAQAGHPPRPSEH
jgi:hypothetical protein